MRLEKIADVKLVGRALVNGWLDGFHERKQAAVDSLFDVVENSEDQELRIKAFEALTRADVVDLKRKELEIRQQAADDERRIRLLELVKSLPSGEVARIASEHKAAFET